MKKSCPTEILLPLKRNQCSLELEAQGLCYKLCQYRLSIMFLENLTTKGLSKILKYRLAHNQGFTGLAQYSGIFNFFLFFFSFEYYLYLHSASLFNSLIISFISSGLFLANIEIYLKFAYQLIIGHYAPCIFVMRTIYCVNVRRYKLMDLNVAGNYMLHFIFVYSKRMDSQVYVHTYI